jgi:hypothetical protein
VVLVPVALGDLPVRVERGEFAHNRSAGRSGIRSFPGVQRSPKAETRRYERAFSGVALRSIPVRNMSLASRHSGSSRTRLGATVTAEDPAEELGALSPHDRVTRRFPRRYLHGGVASPLHAIPVTRHRWCPTCQCTVTVAVDVLAGSARLVCRSCGRFPDTRRAITQSLAESVERIRMFGSAALDLAFVAEGRTDTCAIDACVMLANKPLQML